MERQWAASVEIAIHVLCYRALNIVFYGDSARYVNPDHGAVTVRLCSLIFLFTRVRKKGYTVHWFNDFPSGKLKPTAAMKAKGDKSSGYTESGLKLLGLDLASLATQGVGVEAQPNAYTGYGI